MAAATGKRVRVSPARHAELVGTIEAMHRWREQGGDQGKCPRCKVQAAAESDPTFSFIVRYRPACDCVRVPTPEEEAELSAARKDRRRVEEIRQFRQSQHDYVRDCVGAVHLRSGFGTFHCHTDSQRRARDAVKAFTGNPWALILSGPPAVGKTHLAVSWMRRCWRRSLPAAWMWETRASAEWRKSFAEGVGEADAFIDSLAEAKALVIDDFGVVSPTANGWIVAMNTILCYREAHQLPTLITTNLSSADVARIYGERVASRLGAGIGLRVDGPSGRARESQNGPL